LVNTRTSFFEIEDVIEDKNIIILNDLLNKGRKIELTDFGFSHTAKIDYLTFFRPVSMCGGYITSGIILLYEKRTYDYILRQLQNRNNAKAMNDDLKKYSVFFKLGCRLPVEHK
jgi:hypothetical protein